MYTGSVADGVGDGMGLGCRIGGEFSRCSSAFSPWAQAARRPTVVSPGDTVATYPTVTLPVAGSLRYHSTTGSGRTTLPGSVVKRSVRTLLTTAAGTVSLNQAVIARPFALLAVTVSVSWVPCGPPSVHRRAIVRPDAYRWTGNR